MEKCIIAIIFLFFFSTDSLKTEQPIEVSRGEVIVIEKAEEKLFSGTILLPQKVGINEPFTIRAELKKEVEQEISVMGREKLFSFEIKDINGRQINSYTITDGGKMRVLTGEGIVSEDYKYKIKEAGIYEVKAVADFTVIKESHSVSYKIETKPKKLYVSADE
ncbi:hypothetical protein [Paenibacillus agilis]|uniref:YtkA-like domain-containing protein n=1 Tax=Paenibacillus agilis TaxID=3020863 RepID=A0A559IL41_9BACL|nr:hypothetical protein [Paenibacillus agilis]TVX88374.1 hypothetical protein FPZ44_21060 [Paenibacillus agilis]